jgi:hypothetical protein
LLLELRLGRPQEPVQVLPEPLEQLQELESLEQMRVYLLQQEN